MSKAIETSITAAIKTSRNENRIVDVELPAGTNLIDALVDAGVADYDYSYVNHGDADYFDVWDASHDDDTMDWRLRVTVADCDEFDITDEQIEALRDEAGSAGDNAQVALCDRALDGDDEARAECARVIADAAAQG